MSVEDERVDTEDGEAAEGPSVTPWSRRLAPVREFVATETRFAILERTHPERAAHLAVLAQADADERWRYYTQLAGVQRTVPHVPSADVQPDVESDAGYQYGEGS